MANMNHHDIVQGGWWQSVAGTLLSVWSWLAGDMAGLPLILTVLTIALTAVKLADAINRIRATKGLPARERWRAITRPGDLQ